jgi:hypothetical protein
MAYDLHIVRTRDWTDAASAPITRQDVDALIAADSELEWSKADHVDMRDDTGAVTRYWMINWRGQPCFWWYRDQIQCSGPNEAQQFKLTQMARALGAFAVGDDGETYDTGGSAPRQPATSIAKRVARWFARLRPRRRPVIEHEPLAFEVGDTVRDPWGNEHTVISIDSKAEHGMGVIRTRRSDGTEHAHAMLAHGLESLAKR